MEYEKIRSYEVSIWTLQDDFIAVLKPSDLENKGQIEEGIARMNVDGMRELNFRIPMYIEPGVENPAWYNVRKGFIIANMRKIKVIFNKNTEDEYVLEFLITNVEETHENDQLYCEVKCEGLAFHELGKRGYKLSLNSDDYYMDDNVAAWYDGDSTYQAAHEEPIANIQYWLDKFISPLPENKNNINPNLWYYEICMDWSSLAASGLASNKIYDEEYATTWTTENNKLVADSVMPPKEKSRMVDIDESNYYNITQQLAEIFGVFCKYVYEHDANYHIACRKVVFYNNFYSDKLGFLDFTYPHSAEQIRREIDSTDLVTKLYVKSISDGDSASGQITILDAAANPSGEDYILNFNYLHDVGTISDEQYEEVDNFEAMMHEINEAIIPIDQKLIVLQNKIPEIQGQLTIAQNAAQQDRAGIEDANALFNSLTDDTGVISITAANPATAILLQDSSKASKNYYYIKISEKGVIANTVKIYRTLNYASGTLSNEITGGVPQYDEYGNLARINNLYSTDSDKKTVYVIYNYSPQLYYDNVKKVWEKRLAKDEADAVSLQAQLNALNNEIDQLQTQREQLLASKKRHIALFEEEMGPAIREGYWQPEDYTDYGNRLIDSVRVDISPLNGQIACKTPYAKFIWDTEAFIGEQENSYKIGADQQQQYYPCIRLTDEVIEAIKDHLDELSFLFYDFTSTTTYPQTANKLRSLPLGSQCALAFIQTNTNNYPVLLLNGEKTLESGATVWMKSNGFIGKLTSTVTGGQILTSVETYVSHNKISWLTINANTPVSFPRIKIDSLSLKTTTDDIGLTYNGEKLAEFADYSVMSREDAYYITIKPEVLIRHGVVDKTMSFFYTLSTAATAVYLDALQVSRENAYPKVSYEVDPNVYGKNFMRTAYNTLANLAHINDSELKFDNVMGYISEVELNLDKPWEDRIEIKNYRNKFEDLFATIVAQTEAMKSAQPILASAAQVLTLDGTIAKNAAKNMIRHVDLDYAFNNGTLTIDNENGIWGTSDSGVVAFRGGGIFTATEKNEEGQWRWNTGITPEGINADLITTGQLDTNLIKIYAGDKVKFQMNGDGIYAYKSFLDDMASITSSSVKQTIQNQITANHSANLDIPDDIDTKQYIKYDDNGLFLIAEQGAYVLNKQKNGLIGPLSQTVRRVEISWDGLKLRNWNNQEVLYADPDTGDLNITGNFTASSMYIGGIDYVGDITNISTIGEIADSKAQVFRQETAPAGNGKFHTGDIWQVTGTGVSSGWEYIASANANGNNDAAKWVLVSTSKMTGAALAVDATAGTITMSAANTVTIASGNMMNLVANGAVNITGSSGVNIKSGGHFTVESGGNFSLTSTNFNVTTDGTITAKAGTVGGWTLSNSMLVSGSTTNKVGMSANTATSNNISYSTTIPKGNNTAETRTGYYAFWAGNDDPAQAPFRVTRDGTVFVEKLISKETIENTSGQQTVVYNIYNLSDSTNSSGGGGGGGGGSGGGDSGGGSVDLNPTANMRLTSGWSGNTYTARMYYKNSQRSTVATTYTGSKFDITNASVRNNYWLDFTAAANFEGDGGNWTTNYLAASINAEKVYSNGWSDCAATIRINPKSMTATFGDSVTFNAQYKKYGESGYTTKDSYTFTIPVPSLSISGLTTSATSFDKTLGFGEKLRVKASISNTLITKSYYIKASSPSGTYPINTNGIYNITGWANVNVQVPTGYKGLSVSGATVSASTSATTTSFTVTGGSLSVSSTSAENLYQITVPILINNQATGLSATRYQTATYTGWYYYDMNVAYQLSNGNTGTINLGQKSAYLTYTPPTPTYSTYTASAPHIIWGYGNSASSVTRVYPRDNRIYVKDNSSLADDPQYYKFVNYRTNWYYKDSGSQGWNYWGQALAYGKN